MSWDFETDKEYQVLLDWAADYVNKKAEPLDMMCKRAFGPTEVHKVTVARQLLRDYEGTDLLFPSYTLPNRKADALTRYAGQIEREVETW